MIRKRVVAALCVCLIFLAALTVGLCVLFTTRVVNVNAKVSSSEARAQCENCYDELKVFKGKSLVMISDAQIEEITKKYSNLELVSFEKEFPFTLEVNIVERLEKYAYFDERIGKYVILDVNGEKICEKDSLTNSIDGGANILIDIPAADDYFKCAVTFLSEYEKIDGNVRTIIKSVSAFVPTENSADSFLNVKTYSGVEFSIKNPMKNLKEKTALISEKYLSCTDTQILCGKILCYDVTDSQIRVVYEK